MNIYGVDMFIVMANFFVEEFDSSKPISGDCGGSGLVQAAAGAATEPLLKIYIPISQKAVLGENESMKAETMRRKVLTSAALLNNCRLQEPKIHRIPQGRRA